MTGETYASGTGIVQRRFIHSPHTFPDPLEVSCRACFGSEDENLGHLVGMMGLQPGLKFLETAPGRLDHGDGLGLNLRFALPSIDGLHRGRDIHAGRELRINQLCANLSRRFGISKSRQQGDNVVFGAVLSLYHGRWELREI